MDYLKVCNQAGITLLTLLWCICGLGQDRSDDLCHKINTSFSLHKYAAIGAASIINELIALCPRLASDSITDNSGWTPLMYAVQSGSEETVRVLLAANRFSNESINYRNREDGLSPISIAILTQNVKATKLLLLAGANLEGADDSPPPAIISITRCPPCMPANWSRSKTRKARQALKTMGYKIKLTDHDDLEFREILVLYQRDVHLPQTGLLDDVTFASLLAAGKLSKANGATQKALGSASKDDASENIKSTTQQQYVYLINMFNGPDHCMSIAAGDTHSRLDIEPCKDYAGQRWIIDRFNAAEGWRLRTELSGPSLCLDILNDGVNNKLQMAPCGNYSGQNWFIESTDLHGNSELRTHFTVDNKCLDVVNDGVNDKMQMAPCGNYSGQRWKMVRTPPF